MKRRNFVFNIGLAGLAYPLASFSKNSNTIKLSDPDILIPAKLQEGDTIGIVSPAGAIFETEAYDIAREYHHRSISLLASTAMRHCADK